MEIEGTNNNQPTDEWSGELFTKIPDEEKIELTLKSRDFLLKDNDDEELKFKGTCNFHITTKRFMFDLLSEKMIADGKQFSLWCEYYNCLSHGTSGNKLVLLLGNAILNEKMENGYEPEDSETESQIDSIKSEYERYNVTGFEDDNFLELKCDCTLEVDLGDESINDIFKTFGKCSDLNPDPEEIKPTGAQGMFAGYGLNANEDSDSDEPYEGGFSMDGLITAANVHLFEEGLLNQKMSNPGEPEFKVPFAVYNNIDDNDADQMMEEEEEDTSPDAEKN